MSKTFPITQGVQFSGDPNITTADPQEVNHRLPEGIRWSPVTRELVSDNIPIEDRPAMTAADIDWTGLDQELGDETTLTVGAAILIEELSDAGN